MSEILRTEHLSKRYGTGAYVLSGMTVGFESGSATGLIGPNGSGKTTFIRLLSATAFPTEGHVLFQGIDIHEQPHQFLKHVGLAGDSHNLPVYLNAVELMEWILRSKKKWTAGSDEKISALLDSVLLDERRENLIGTYSSGMMQKSLIAASLVAEPEIILLDEPFRALDTDSVKACIGLLESYRKNGGTLIISSHVKHTLDQLCSSYITFPALHPA
ncbi:MAG: ABC transporter ATP-binding protein [Balneolales bacterium]